MKKPILAEKEIGTGFMCLRDSIYLESSSKILEEVKNENTNHKTNF